MRVAVTGAGGQLGQDLVRYLPRLGEFDVVALDRAALDVTDAASVERVIGEGRFDSVVNCSAMTNVDRCEEEPEQALGVNARGAYLLARACAAAACHFVQVSTDFVFDGEKSQPYSEEDRPGPVNVYGVSKLAGEQLALLANPRTLVARVSSVFGRAGSRGKGGNFVEKMIARARAGQPLSVVDDIEMSPTYTVDAVHALAELLNASASGTVHVANRGACTWHAFATAALAAAGLTVEVKRIASSEVPRVARRPRNSALVSRRLEGHIGREMRPWQEALEAYLEEKR